MACGPIHPEPEQAMSATHPNDKLVRMANQIALFFRSYPENEAVAGIHNHIVAFWTPKMRRDIEDYADEAGERFTIKLVLEILEFADCAPPRKVTVFKRGDTG